MRVQSVPVAVLMSRLNGRLPSIQFGRKVTVFQDDLSHAKDQRDIAGLTAAQMRVELFLSCRIESVRISTLKLHLPRPRPEQGFPPILGWI